MVSNIAMAEINEVQQKEKRLEVTTYVRFSKRDACVENLCSNVLRFNFLFVQCNENEG